MLDTRRTHTEPGDLTIDISPHKAKPSLYCHQALACGCSEPATFVVVRGHMLLVTGISHTCTLASNCDGVSSLHPALFCHWQAVAARAQT